MARTAPLSPEILQLRITLMDSDPAIQRRVEVSASSTLRDLHRVIQAAFLWENDHLYQFLAGGHSRTQRIRSGLSPLRGGKSIPLGELFTRRGQTLYYEYDFGDCWLHEIRLEAMTSRENGAAYPRCTEALRSAPPEDCGGIFGYEHLLEVLADPSHEEHEELREWAGEGFDPENPNLPLVEKRMNRLRRRTSHKSDGKHAPGAARG